MIKIGNVVRTLKSGKIGIVVSIAKNRKFVMINFSDTTGVMFRWCHIDYVESVNETR